MTFARIGLISIGQSPRDDLIPEMVAQLGRQVDVIQADAVNGLTLEAVLESAPEGDQRIRQSEAAGRLLHDAGADLI